MRFVIFIACLLICLRLDAWRSFIDETYSLYSASDWEPKLHYPHNATNGWWSDSIVPPAPAGGLVQLSRNSNVELGHLAWESGPGPTNSHGRINVRKGDSFANAVWLMMARYSASVAPQPFPVATGSCTNIGDICYTGYPAGSMTSLSFIRNNIYVSISSTDEVWATNTAFTIDAAILNASTNTVSNNNWLQRLMNK